MLCYMSHKLFPMQRSSFGLVGRRGRVYISWKLSMERHLQDSKAEPYNYDEILNQLEQIIEILLLVLVMMWCWRQCIAIS